MKVNQLKIGAILSYAVIVLNMIIGLVYTPILIRNLGQSEYGLYSLIASVISYLTVLDLGFGNAITIYTSRYIAKGENEKAQKLHGTFFLIYILIGIVTAVAGFILYLNVDNMFGNTLTTVELDKAKILMLILTFNLVVTFPFSIFSAIISAHEKFVFSRSINILRIILQPLIMLPLLFWGAKSITLVIVITVLNILTLLINAIFCFKKLDVKFKFGKLEKGLLKEICGYSFFIFLNIIIDKVNWSVDQFILGTIVGTSAVALYATAAQLNSMYLNFSTAISGVLLPKVTKMEANNASDKEFTDIFIRTGRIQYVVLALIITGFVLFGKEFIEMIWVGKEYTESYYIACILMIPLTIPLIQNVGLSILQAKNRYKYRTMIFIGIAVLNIAISIPLANIYGGIGTALGTAISLLLGQGIILNIYYWKKIKIDIPKFWKEILKMSLPIILVFLFGMFLHKYWVISNILILILQITIYTGLYALFMWNFSMNNYEKDVVRKPLLKITNKIFKKR